MDKHKRKEMHYKYLDALKKEGIINVRDITPLFIKFFHGFNEVSARQIVYAYGRERRNGNN
ncbi:MAG: hypothetical protein KAS04_06030 [Candidatus Aenigmarchaeota archaeon]|nr:hypothetical protein [Candidatus Aenigmarchaeota archaeon]